MSTTEHPLTEADAAGFWEASTDLPYWRDWTVRERAEMLAAFRAAFDAGREHERTMPAGDSRPWEPLSGPVYVGDEVRQDWDGITTSAVVGRVDEDGDPWTAEERFIGTLDDGTWYVRRAVQELPTESGAVIVPADGYKRIEAAPYGSTYFAREAALVGGHWQAVWRTAAGIMSLTPMAPEDITPGTWKVDDQ